MRRPGEGVGHGVAAGDGRRGGEGGGIGCVAVHAAVWGTGRVVGVRGADATREEGGRGY